MVYHSHGVTLSAAQVRSLSTGNAIRLKHAHLTGTTQLHLTQQQLNRLARAAGLHKGMTLRLSQAQLAYHRKNGSGLFDTIRAQGARLIKDHAADAISYLGQKGGQYAADKISQLGQRGGEYVANRFGGSFLPLS
jgi:hypothetical protein